MQTGPSAIDDYANAVAFERAAWNAVRDHLPGSAKFDDALWKQWRKSVDDADLAAGRARIALTAPRARGPLAGILAKPVKLSPIFSRLRPPGA